MRYFCNRKGTAESRPSAKKLGRVWTPLFVCFLAVVWSCASYADFSYSDFPDAGDGAIAGMTFNGTSLPAWYEGALPGSTGDPDNRLRITDDLLGDQRGSAWHNTKQTVDTGFRTTFRYKFTGLTADGIAFVIQNDAAGTAALGTDIDGGGGKGYAGIPNSLAIEIDTWNGGSANPDEIAIHTMGTDPNRHNSEARIGSITFAADNEEHDVKIIYNPGKLRVYHDDMDTPILTADYDLTGIGLDAGAAYVGFTGATGGGTQTAEILNWTFIDTDAEPPTNPAISSPTHVFPSPETMIVVKWSGAGDDISGVSGYSFLFDTNSATAPDTTENLAHSADPHTTSSATLGEGTYYFHIRTHDNSGKWSSAKHFGPLVIDFAAPPVPVGVPVVLGLLGVASFVVGVRALHSRRR
jgi:hypothetical protein